MSDTHIDITAVDTQEELRAQALEQLAIIGGKLSREDDVTFSGTKFVLPEHLDLRGAVRFLKQRMEAEEELNEFSRTFNYRPWDGARATGLAIKEAFGFLVGKTIWTFFGPERPQLIDIPVGPNGQMEQVPWGAMTIPGLEGTTLHLGSTKKRLVGEVFHISVTAPLAHRDHIEGLFKLIDKHLAENSLYRGKSFDSMGDFIDTSAVRAERLVYTDSVQRRLDGDLWSFIRFDKQLAKHGQDGKYAVLLHGPYGTGKTEAAGVTAQIANQHGWAFITSKAGEGELIKAMELAKLYQPAVVFAEDVETEGAAPGDPSQMSKMLDMMDGFHAKGQKLIVVFTSNNAERIQQGMLRPGRIGAVIRIGEMDRAGIEKLTRLIVGKNLEDDIDFDAVANAMEGYMPAFVREALNRAVRYCIASNDGVMGKIGTFALCDAADGLRDQLALMNGAPTDRIDETLATTIGRIVSDAVDGVVVDRHGDHWGTLVTTATNGE